MWLKMAGASENALIAFPALFLCTGALSLGYVVLLRFFLRKVTENCSIQRTVFPLDLTSNEKNVTCSLCDL